MRSTRASLFVVCGMSGIALAISCNFTPGTLLTGDSAPGDGPRDGAIDARLCFGSGLVTVCLTATPQADYTTTGAVDLNTDTDCTQTQSQDGGPDLCILAAQTIHINNNVDVGGLRPLVLVATDTLSIGSNGMLDLSSHYTTNAFGQINGQQLGAGEASPELCGTGTQGANDALGTTATGAGGGAGASLGGMGGAGAAGRNGAGGAGGTPSAPIAVTFVRGGCRGTPGGNGDNNTGGPGGHGGGAVYLIAGTSITIAGTISASGQGGRGGQPTAGGGGGGGGGLIGLDAPIVMSSGVIFANGGGGGEGGGSNAGDYGSSALSATTRAAGGSGEMNGGNGGRGAAGTIIDGEAGSADTNGGGGGGGGIGVIRVFPLQPLGGTVSPPPS